MRLASFAKRLWANTRVFLKRLRAYAGGDFDEAAGIDGALVKRDADVPWLKASSTEATVDYALEAAIRSAAFAEDSAAGLTTKASTLITVIMAVFVLALGGTGLAIHTSHNPGWIGLLSIALFIAVDLWLVLAALHAFLATAPAHAGGSNIKRLGGPRTALSTLKREEVLAWHEGALRAMEVATCRGTDLFTARRCLLASLLFAPLALIAMWVRAV